VLRSHAPIGQTSPENQHLPSSPRVNPALQTHLLVAPSKYSEMGSHVGGVVGKVKFDNAPVDDPLRSALELFILVLDKECSAGGVDGGDDDLLLDAAKYAIASINNTTINTTNTTMPAIKPLDGIMVKVRYIIGNGKKIMSLIYHFTASPLRCSPYL
jgi:hypothetical protein